MRFSQPLTLVSGRGYNQCLHCSQDLAKNSWYRSHWVFVRGQEGRVEHVRRQIQLLSLFVRKEFSIWLWEAASKLWIRVVVFIVISFSYIPTLVCVRGKGLIAGMQIHASGEHHGKKHPGESLHIWLHFSSSCHNTNLATLCLWFRNLTRVEKSPHYSILGSMGFLFWSKTIQQQCLQPSMAAKYL